MESDGMIMPKWADTELAANTITITIMTDKIEFAERITHTPFFSGFGSIIYQAKTCQRAN
jgi:hypothetical protein